MSSGTSWLSAWDIGTFIEHLNEKGIDQVCAKMQVRRLEKTRKYNTPTLETTFGDEDVAESIG